MRHSTAFRSAVVLLLVPILALAAINFPELTGRVVDNADMLDEQIERSLSGQLAAHENANGNQIVVVTVPDLQGNVIEDFGYQLGRHWGIGQKGEDNGVLLIVARDERKVRIEVGYGLEGQLTDAIAFNIIHSVILPQFRKGNFSGGIAVGVDAIIQALGGEYVIQESRDKDSPSFALLWPFVFIWILIMVFSGLSGGVSRRGRGIGGGYYGGGGFGGGGGGFSGGGGGFGGGGASGGW